MKTQTLEMMTSGEELVWLNPKIKPAAVAFENIELSAKDVDDAAARLHRFAPFIMKCFPETAEKNGMIESELTPIPEMKSLLNKVYCSALKGKLLLNRTAILPLLVQ